MRRPIAPAGGDHGERLEDEAAPAKLRVGDGQAGASGTGRRSTARCRGRARAAPSGGRGGGRIRVRCALRRRSICGGLEVAFDERDGIGEVAAGAADAPG